MPRATPHVSICRYHVGIKPWQEQIHKPSFLHEAMARATPQVVGSHFGMKTWQEQSHKPSFPLPAVARATPRVMALMLGSPGGNGKFRIPPFCIKQWQGQLHKDMALIFGSSRGKSNSTNHKCFTDHNQPWFVLLQSKCLDNCGGSTSRNLAFATSRSIGRYVTRSASVKTFCTSSIGYM